MRVLLYPPAGAPAASAMVTRTAKPAMTKGRACLLYTSDAADERSSVDLGGRRIIKKKKTTDSAARCRRTISDNMIADTKDNMIKDRV